MAPFFHDGLTGTTTLLQNWTPSVAGNSWSYLWSGTANGLQVIANGVRNNGNAGDVGNMYAAEGNYPASNANYDTSIDFIDTFNGVTPVYVFARSTDRENMYAARIVGDTVNGSQLYKKVAGSWSTLGSGFTVPANSLFTLSVSGTSIKAHVNSVEAASATDSDLSSVGKAGVGHGGGTELAISTDDVRAVVMFRNFRITEIAASGPATQIITGSAVVNTNALGQPVISVGAVTINVTGIQNNNGVGSPTITVGSVNISVSGIGNVNAFGQATVSGDVETQFITGSGIAANNGLGLPTIQPGAVNISVSGIASVNALGLSTVTTQTYISGTGIENANGVGLAVIGVGAVVISGSGIENTNGIGLASISIVQTQIIGASGIVNISVVSNPTVFLPTKDRSKKPFSLVRVRRR